MYSTDYMATDITNPFVVIIWAESITAEGRKEDPYSFPFWLSFRIIFAEIQLISYQTALILKTKIILYLMLGGGVRWVIFKTEETK